MKAFRLVYCLLVGCLLQALDVWASACPSIEANKADLETMDSCSKDASTADWGKCLQCSGVCQSLAFATTACVLSYNQLLTQTGRACSLDPSICSAEFRNVLNSTCAAAVGSSHQCASFPLVPVIAGSVGGAVVLCLIVLGCFEYRRRMAIREARERRQRKAERKAREAEMAAADNPQPQQTKQKWRPSFVKRTQAVVNEMAKHQSLRAQGSAMVVNSGLSPMSSSPGMSSHNSFRGPPPLTSHNSFRGPPPGPPPMASSNSFRGQPVMTAHDSFRGPPPLASHNSFHGPPLTSQNSFRGPPPGAPPMVSHNSFRGPPPLTSHPSYGNMPMAAPPLQQHNSFRGPLPFNGAAPSMAPAPQLGGMAPLPPPSRNSGAMMAPGAGATPVVPPSRNSGAVTKPAAAPVAAAPVPVASEDSSAEDNPLLAQIRIGKNLRKVKQEEKKAEEKPKKADPPPEAAGGAGGLMAELQKKMKKKRGSVVQ